MILLENQREEELEVALVLIKEFNDVGIFIVVRCGDF